ncbi:AAEL012755-PA [Aedes aegypti]|uniref:AAEL012755-PA n=2 Tax=Aedes aegypti TaxID=7159 RepID=A0A1S4FWZ4_AEDAE|nr:uncharacterized protein LOC5576769 [Aedes aegypti]EAT35052.1 AAEL012755-PA [Aedes aegypti]
MSREDSFVILGSTPSSSLEASYLNVSDADILSLMSSSRHQSNNSPMDDDPTEARLVTQSYSLDGYRPGDKEHELCRIIQEHSQEEAPSGVETSTDSAAKSSPFSLMPKDEVLKLFWESLQVHRTMLDDSHITVFENASVRAARMLQTPTVKITDELGKTSVYIGSNSNSTQEMKQEVIEDKSKQGEYELFKSFKKETTLNSTLSSELMNDQSDTKTQAEDQQRSEKFDSTECYDTAITKKMKVTTNKTLQDANVTASTSNLNQSLPLIDKETQSLEWDSALDNDVIAEKCETIARLEAENKKLKLALADAKERSYQQNTRLEMQNKRLKLVLDDAKKQVVAQETKLTKALAEEHRRKQIERISSLHAIDALRKRLSEKDAILKNQVCLIARLEHKIKERDAEFEKKHQILLEELTNLRAEQGASGGIVANERNAGGTSPDTSINQAEESNNFADIACPLCNDSCNGWEALEEHVQICVAVNQLDVM